MIVKRTKTIRTATQPSVPSGGRSVNWRLLITTVFLTAVIGIAGYFWHLRQQGVVARAFLDHATKCEKKEQHSKASRHLFNYLKLCPNDAEARIRLARTYAKSVSSGESYSQAISLFYRAIGVSDEAQANELRSQLIDMLVATNRLPEAVQESTQRVSLHPQYSTLASTKKSIAMQEPPEDVAHAWRQLAQARYLQMKSFSSETSGDADDNTEQSQDKTETVTTGECLEAAILLNPTDLELPAMLADVYLNAPESLNPEQRKTHSLELAAEIVLDEMVDRNGESGLAYLVRARFHAVRGDFETVESDVEKALRLDKQDTNIILFGARFYRDQARRLQTQPDARSTQQAEYLKSLGLYLSLIQDFHSKEPQIYLEAGQIHLEMGNAKEAEQVWELALEKTVGANPLYVGLIELYTNTGQFEEAQKVLQKWDEKLSSIDTKTNIFSEYERARDLLAANLKVAQNDTGQALELLKPIANDPSSDTATRSTALVQIGQAYSKQNLWDLAAAAYESALRLDRTNTPLRQLTASAWEKARNPRKALEHMAVIQSQSQSVELKYKMLQLEIDQQILLPTSERDWSQVDSGISELCETENIQKLARPWRVDLLRASLELVRAQQPTAQSRHVDKALKILRPAEEVYQGDVAFMRILALRYETLGLPMDADRVLDKCREMDDNWETQLCAARILTRRSKWQLARETLTAVLPDVDKERAFLIKLGLARLSFIEGDKESAEANLATIEENTNDFSIISQVIQLRNEFGISESERHEAILVAKEGQDGTMWRVLKAERLLNAARVEEDVQERERLIEEASSLQKAVEKRRPYWSSTSFLAGRIEDLKGNQEQALQAYQRALEQGNVSVELNQRIAELLQAMGRYTEANDYLRNLKNQIPKSSYLSDLAIHISIGNNDLTEAERYASQRVDERPEDPLALVWHGEVLRMKGETERAQQQLEKAIELAPRDINIWFAYFRFQAMTKQGNAARKTLANAMEVCEFAAKGQRNFTLAQGYELLGEPSKAKAEYLNAIKVAPDNPRVRLHFAKLCFNHFRKDAEKSLRDFLDLATGREELREESGKARRSLALILASKGTESDFQEAIALLEDNGKAVRTQVNDKRLQAILYSRGANRDLSKAQDILENIIEHGQPTKGDRIALGLVYYNQIKDSSEEDTATKQRLLREQFEFVCRGSDATAQHLRMYIKVLIDLRDPQADDWIDRFATIAPTAITTLYLRLQSQKAQGRSVDITELVKQYRQHLDSSKITEKQLASALAKLADFCMQMQKPSLAYNYSQEAYQLEPRYVGGLVASSIQLANADNDSSKLERALDLAFTNAQDSNDASSVLFLVTALMNARVAPANIPPKANELIDKCLAKNRENINLMLAVANLRIIANRPQDAITLYREVLAKFPNNTVALNNLATLLGEAPDRASRLNALQIIDKAIRLSGEHPTLLDTRGMVLVNLQRYDEALDNLQKATMLDDSDPLFIFHLAAALLRSGKPVAARSQYAEAKSRGLEKSLLTEADLQVQSELEQLTSN